MARERRHRSRPRRRRGRFSGLYKLLFILLVTAAVVAACVVFFRVNTVTVEGNTMYTDEEVIEASGIETGDNLVALPKSKIAARIRVGLPFVSSVSIRRVPPDQVTLVITEHAVAAAVSDEMNGWWHIAASGKILEQVSDPGDVMIIEGLTAMGPILGDNLAVSESQQNRKEYVIDLLGELEQREILGDCTKLDCSTAGVILLDYLDFQIKLPTTGDFSYMFSMLDEAFESGRVSRTDAGTFDFTVADGKVYFSRT